MNSTDAPSMSAKDIQRLVNLAQSINLNAKRVIGELTVYGIYFVLCGMALYTIVQRPQKSIRTYLLLSALVLTSAITTLQCGLDIAVLISRTQTSLINNPQDPFSSRLTAFTEAKWFINAQYITIVLTGTADSGLVVSSNYVSLYRCS
jgi:uncharacterized membrane protein